jgi:hypothetical protein
MLYNSYRFMHIRSRGQLQQHCSTVNTTPTAASVTAELQTYVVCAKPNFYVCFCCSLCALCRLFLKEDGLTIFNDPRLQVSNDVQHVLVSTHSLQKLQSITVNRQRTAWPAIPT